MRNVRQAHQVKMRELKSDSMARKREAEADRNRRTRFTKPTTSVLEMKARLKHLQQQQRFEEAKELHSKIFRMESEAAATKKSAEDQRHATVLEEQSAERAKQVRQAHRAALSQKALMLLRRS